MNHILIDKLLRRWPVERWTGLTVMVACSGGADSTALARALSHRKPDRTTLILAHFNHRLRGEESDQDERFVEQLADELGCAFTSDSRGESSVRSDEKGDRAIEISEAHLREMRYRFLTERATQFGARYVALAHTADDSVETMLHNLARGSGLAGLSGIPPFRDLGEMCVLIRPLIDVWRGEVLDYLDSLGQCYRTDSSNASLDYTRNVIRHRWLPTMEETMGNDVRSSIHRSASILAELQTFLADEASRWLDEASRSASTCQQRFELRLTPDITRRWPVVQAGLAALWRRNGWPLMEMSQKPLELSPIAYRIKRRCPHWG